MLVTCISGLGRTGVEDWETVLDHSQPLPPGHMLLQYWSPLRLNLTPTQFSPPPLPSLQQKKTKRHVHKHGLKVPVQEVVITGFLSP